MLRAVVETDNTQAVAGLHYIHDSCFWFFCDNLWIIFEQQGSRLKADYVVTWDKDEFFRNSRNQTQEKNNAISTTASDHYRSEAPRRQVYNSHHSPDKVRSRRFRVRFWYVKGYIFSRVLYFPSWTISNWWQVY